MRKEIKKMNAYDKKIDILEELYKTKTLYMDLVQKYLKLQSELEETKKEAADWSAMASRNAGGR